MQRRGGSEQEDSGSHNTTVDVFYQRHEGQREDALTSGERKKTQIDRRYDGEQALYAEAPPPPPPPCAD